MTGLEHGDSGIGSDRDVHSAKPLPIKLIVATDFQKLPKVQ